jgi:predicted small lipoprotein YifL
VNPTDRRFARLALAGLLVAAFGLSACGRKGPLDPPPGAQAQQVQQGNSGPGTTPAPPPPQTYDAAGNPIAPKGEKKPFMLDWLLN